MRAEAARDGSEERDSLAHGWAALLAGALPDAAWLALPSIGAGTARLAAELGVDAVVLTGGNDVGACARRDAAEAALLRMCLTDGIPVLGVCRGLQVVQTFFGGALVEAGAGHDRGRRHAITVTDARARTLLGCARLDAPSYHRFGVRAPELAPALEAWAVADDGLVEMLAHRSARLVAVQWHPERPLPEPEVAQRLLRGFCDAR